MARSNGEAAEAQGNGAGPTNRGLGQRPGHHATCSCSAARCNAVTASEHSVQRHSGMPAVPQAPDEFVGARAEAVEGETRVCQVVEPHLLAGQWVAGRDHGDDRVGGQRRELQRVWPGAGDDETQVGRAVDEHGNDAVGVGVTDLDAAAQGPECFQDHGDHTVREGRVHGHAEPGRRVECPHRTARVVEERDGALGVGHERVACGRQGRPFVLRWKRGAPTSRSRRAIRSLTAGWETRRECAARPKLPLAPRRGRRSCPLIG